METAWTVRGGKGNAVKRPSAPRIPQEDCDALPPGTPFHHIASAEVSRLRIGLAIGLCVFGSIAIKQIPGHDILAVHWTSDGVPAMPMFGPATGVVSWYAETALALPLLLTVVLV